MQSSDGCWCDDACVENGDCCSDKAEICPHMSCRNTDCEGMVTDPTTEETCYCDDLCERFKDCCDDYKDYCDAA